MFTRSIPLLLTAMFLLSPALAEQARMARHPAPSPDGSTIAFSWQGDIWTVAAAGGPARRLTVHPAYEAFPVWSRDGRWLAFSSQRYGNGDVFAIPADGSAAPRRLTFASAGDRPLDFTPDGQAVLFRSLREESFRRSPALYRVNLSGGTPVLEQAALGLSGRFSPDGKRLLFVRGGTKPLRRGYRGAANRDLWLRDEKGEFQQLTQFDGDDDQPGWVDDQSLVFLSSRSGRKNLHLLDLATGRIQALTDHADSAVRFPRVSQDGSLVAFEFEEMIYTLSLPDGTPRKLAIDLPSDWLRARIERKSTSKGAEEFTIRPDGKLAAFTVHGELFVTAVRSKSDQEIAASPTVRITRTAAPETDISWTPDGKRLVFTATSDDSRGIFTASPSKGDELSDWLESFDFKIEPLVKNTGRNEQRAQFSPDGKQLAFVRGPGELVVTQEDGSHEKVLLDHWTLGNYQWSPDGKWIVYDANDVEYNSEIFIVSSGGGPAYNLSRHPDTDNNASWSADGKRIIWRSKRHLDTLDLWSVWLSREDDERSAEGWLAHWNAKTEKNEKGEKGNKEEKKSKKSKKNKITDEEAGDPEEKSPRKLPEVTIDFDRLWERAGGLTTLEGDEGTALVVAGGKKILFTAAPDGKRDLYSVRWNGEELKRLTEGGKSPGVLQLDESGKSVFFLSSGKINRVTLDGKSGDPIPFTARYEIDRLKQREVVFHQGWDALSEWFYDPQFHGVDWPAQRDKYLPWALSASTDRDFAAVMNLMFGELNASHMGYYPGGRRAPTRGEKTGYIGALFDPSAGGPGILIREILQDSPAARTDVALLPGERLIAVGGQSVEAETNVYGLFVETIDQRTALRILDAKGDERTAVVTPVALSAQRQLRYKQWVRQRRQIVERLSDGRIGYLHVQSMSIPPFEIFERDLFSAAHGKQGLLIDVRSNGGGWTTDYLMAVLSVRRHAYTVPRGSEGSPKAYPQSRLPLAAWTKPALTLCDEASYSNAEIFSRAFKNLDRGLVVGTPTFGAVISTGGTTTIDGALVRLPFRGWYDALTGENQENHGVVPDLIVARPPAEDTNGQTDTQLAAAVKALLESLASDPRAGAW